VDAETSHSRQISRKFCKGLPQADAETSHSQQISRKLALHVVLYQILRGRAATKHAASFLLKVSRDAPAMPLCSKTAASTSEATIMLEHYHQAKMPIGVGRLHLANYFEKHSSEADLPFLMLHGYASTSAS
jgi:hypothetical protein